MTGDSNAADRESWLGLGLLALMLTGSLLVMGAAFVGATYSDSADSANSDFAADVLDPASGLDAGAIGLGTASLSWTASPDAYATGYRIMRSTGGAFTEIATVTPGTTVTYEDDDIGLLGIGTYSYYVVAYYEGWNSVPSNTVVCIRALFLLTC
jgi:hypothetical protein